jgi:hypothetical protein
LQDFITRLTKAGIAYEDLQGTPGAITLRPDGIQQIYFRDPDGYWIEMTTPASNRRLFKIFTMEWCRDALYQWNARLLSVEEIPLIKGNGGCCRLSVECGP